MLEEAKDADEVAEDAIELGEVLEVADRVMNLLLTLVVRTIVFKNVPKAEAQKFVPTAVADAISAVLDYWNNR